MHLYLLRHAEAIDSSPDNLRPLTTKGRDDTARLGKLLKTQGVQLPKRVWVSPYLRAQETAQILLKAAHSDADLETRDDITPEDSVETLLPDLNAIEEDLLLVGHNPHLSILASQLLGGHQSECIIQYRKCALARFERIRFFSPNTPARWALDWFIPPKLFR